MGAGPSKDTTEALSTAATTTEVSVSLRQLHDRLKHGRGMSEEQLEAARLAFNELAVREGLRGGAPIPLSSAFPLLYGGIDFTDVELVVWSKGNTLHKNYAENIKGDHILYIEHADKDTVEKLVEEYSGLPRDGYIEDDYFQNLLGFICSDGVIFKEHIPGLQYWTQYFKPQGNVDFQSLSKNIKQIQTIVCPVQPLDEDSYKGIVSGCMSANDELTHDVQVNFKGKGDNFTRDEVKNMMKQILNEKDPMKHSKKQIILDDYVSQFNDVVKNMLKWAIHLKSITINIEEL